MNSASDHLIAQHRRVNSSRISGGSEVFDPTVIYNKDIEGKWKSYFPFICSCFLFIWRISYSFSLPFFPSQANQRAILVEWMNSTVPSLNFPVKASSEQLRTCLIDGTVLLQILNRLRPGFSYKVSYLLWYLCLSYLWLGIWLVDLIVHFLF
jgi:kinesin family protein C2/C3